MIIKEVSFIVKSKIVLQLTYRQILVFTFIVFAIFIKNCFTTETTAPIPNSLPNATTTPKTRFTNVTNQTQPEEEPHIGRLDIRVGKIVSVEKHPDADTLYLEKVDVGEEQPRTIISGLVKHVPIEEMQNKSALFIMNLKAVKMRGILSEGMIMCAHNDDGKVEILIPPPTAEPGEFVTVDGYERKPDTRIDSKKKVFQGIQQNLKTNAKREATYKDIPWRVADKGLVTSSSLTNASIC